MRIAILQTVSELQCVELRSTILPQDW